MRRNRHSRFTHRAFSNINLTNLIDVFIVTLFVYIIITPLVEQGININLPESSPRKIESTNSVTIAISREGKLYLENLSLSMAQLKENLLHKLQRKPDLGVIIKADEGIRYGTVIEVLDELNNAGVTNVGMATETKKS